MVLCYLTCNSVYYDIKFYETFLIILIFLYAQHSFYFSYTFSMSVFAEINDFYLILFAATKNALLAIGMI